VPTTYMHNKGLRIKPKVILHLQNCC